RRLHQSRAPALPRLGPDLVAALVHRHPLPEHLPAAAALDHCARRAPYARFARAHVPLRDRFLLLRGPGDTLLDGVPVVGTFVAELCRRSRLFVVLAIDFAACSGPQRRGWSLRAAKAASVVAIWRRSACNFH